MLNADVDKYIFYRLSIISSLQIRLYSSRATRCRLKYMSICARHLKYHLSKTGPLSEKLWQLSIYLEICETILSLWSPVVLRMRYINQRFTYFYYTLTRHLNIWTVSRYLISYCELVQVTLNRPSEVTWQRSLNTWSSLMAHLWLFSSVIVDNCLSRINLETLSNVWYVMNDFNWRFKDIIGHLR